MNQEAVLMENCIFCHHIEATNILAESTYFFAVFDIDPIQTGHILVISKKHYETMLDIPNEILLDLLQFEKQIIATLENNFDVLGATIAQNNGAVMDDGTHFHAHLIPRYQDDAFWDSQTVAFKPLDLELLKEKLKNRL
ncbi:HIT family protein [Vagococcus fluvialis]|uniref:HIT family protein n=1 Tax=Vagococcus fluvialis TaxID=2738 RepID=UPI00222389F3|nr:HIT family protein [Vagococcus fluvialis]MDT2745830.1 HIT family protein [Vagococcus fluvialis]